MRSRRAGPGTRPEREDLDSAGGDGTGLRLPLGSFRGENFGPVVGAACSAGEVGEACAAGKAGETSSPVVGAAGAVGGSGYKYLFTMPALIRFSTDLDRGFLKYICADQILRFFSNSSLKLAINQIGKSFYTSDT